MTRPTKLSYPSTVRIISSAGITWATAVVLATRAGQVNAAAEGSLQGTAFLPHPDNGVDIVDGSVADTNGGNRINLNLNLANRFGSVALGAQMHMTPGAVTWSLSREMSGGSYTASYGLSTYTEFAVETASRIRVESMNTNFLLGPPGDWSHGGWDYVGNGEYLLSPGTYKLGANVNGSLVGNRSGWGQWIIFPEGQTAPLPPPPPPPARTFGVSIGVDDGPHLRGDLDATQVFNELHRRPMWADASRGNTTAALKLGEAEPGGSRVRAALSAMDVRDGDTVVFYFSGHGGTLPTGLEAPVLKQVRNDDDGRVTLVTSTDDEAIGLGADVWSDDNLADEFRSARWKNVRKVFILDTCRAGGFVGDSPNDLGDLETLPNVALIAAGYEGGFAFSDRDGRGIWTKLVAPMIATHSFDQLKAEGDAFRDFVLTTYGALHLSLREFYLNGETLPMQAFQPYFYASPDFDTTIPLAGAVPEPTYLLPALLMAAATRRRQRRRNEPRSRARRRPSEARRCCHW